MPANQRILFPFLVLLFTTLAFALVLFISFLNSSLLARLLQGPTAFHSLPSWLRYCLLHPMLLKTVFRAGFGFSVLGSMLTLFLLLKSEPPEKAYGHLAGIGWAVLLVTGAFFVLILGLASVMIHTNLHRFSPSGQQLYLNSLAIDSGKALLAIGALVFVIAAIISSLGIICGRMKKQAPARQTPHVLQ